MSEHSTPADERRIVVTGGTFPEPALRALREAGFEVRTVGGDLDEEGVVQALDGAWGYVLGGSERMTAKAWDRLPDLAAACFMGTGYSSFLELPAGPSPIRFSYTPHANAVAVAEFTVAHLLDLVRAVSRTAAEVAAGQWSERATPSLVGARLGIAGMGHIGREVARMVHAAFGTEIVYWNRSRRPELEALPYRAVPSLLDLFETADVVSVHFAHEPGQNDGVIGADHLRALGPDGYLANLSRANVVDPAALRSALAEGWIAGASIDGYYTEPTPSPAADPYGLLRFVPDRLLVTPHSAYHSAQAVRSMADMAVGNLLAVGRGEPAPHPIPVP
ncbi:phosphoglycerate dehydrogenase-like enzyme [Kitasatospora sp. MAA4]|uniref:2-hydroxyacid dehydrogenase n=1 Tax=Kitasatospora sp. MAA4 TaxID=3035093 RepID=UPI0024758CA1|nr:NAD(P)-dependent oxidoreductase [Kitasatospora sp. MAA4]MDH6132907.1 phosphoglycerate dehydrogenase-like enzyme [Kitasatospora sp. MAA4]